MDKEDWLNKYIEAHKTNELEHYNLTGNTFPSLLPLAMKVSAKTMASDYYYESEERIQKRNRVKKLERIINKETFDDIVNKDEYDDIMIEKKDCFSQGLISVQPMSAPKMDFSYFDIIYNYESEEDNKRKRINNWLNKYIESHKTNESEEDKRNRIRKERLEKMKRILGESK